MKQFLIKILRLKTYQKLLIAALAAILIYVFLNINYWVYSNKYIATDYSVYQTEKKELKSGTPVNIEIEEPVKISENLNYELGIIPSTTNIYVRSKKTGKTWHSILEDVAGMHGEELNNAQSNILLEYEARANKATSVLSSYKYSVLEKGYAIEAIEGGLRVTYYIAESTISMEYFPKKLSFERMDELILNNDILSESEKNFVIRAIYEKNNAQNCYVRKDSASLNNRKKMKEILYDICGYTHEDLIRDNEAFEIETVVAAIPEFTIALEVYLHDDSIKVNVPTYAFDESSDYRIKSVSVLPYFGAAGNNKSGYMFVPDGSGALIDYNSYTSAGYLYTKQVYDNDALYNDGFAYHYSYSEEINLPVFGTVNNTDNFGLMGVIQNGGEMASIVSSPAGFMNYKYNLVYTKISYYIEDNMGLYNIYDPNKVLVVSKEPVYYDYELIYYMLEEDDNSYYGMAKLYQQYLIDRFDLDANYQNDPVLNIEAVGGITVRNNLFGFSYDEQIPLTTVADLMTIAGDLSDNDLRNINFVYSAWCNDGINQTSLAKIKMMSSLGKQKSLAGLNAALGDKGYSVYYAFDLLKVYKNGAHGFNKNKYATRTMDNDAFAFRRYSRTTYKFDPRTADYYFLSPKYIEAMILNINKYIDSRAIDNVVLNDLGSTFIADYNRARTINGFVGRALVVNGFEKLTAKSSILRDPYDYVLGYADYLLDVKYESSNLYCFSHTVPFKQLVYNGLINYSLSDVNNNTVDFSETSYLKCLETGADLKYLITYRNSSALKNTEFNFIYASDYADWREEMIGYYNRYYQDYMKIGSRVITNHEIAGDMVYKVTYAGGATAIYNYSHADFVYEDKSIAPNSMYILEVNDET